MESTEQLRHEHAVIKQVLAALKASAARQDVSVATLRDLVRFSQTFVDRCHHGKEEGCLFPCLEERGIPREGGPIGVMLMEHEMGRSLVRSIDEAVAQFEAGTVEKAHVLGLVTGYVELLEGHIHKEDNVLFAMASRVMAEKDDRETMGCYEETEAERVGPGVHEEMLALAAKIEAAARPGDA